MSNIVSGVQITGNLHLGNYLGAIRYWIEMQHYHQCFFFLADLHSITTKQDTNIMRTAIMTTVASYLAAGLSPDKVHIFTQSAIPEHLELAWMLGCVTPIGWLKRMTQFKDQAKANAEEKASLGLFAYPVLMAADILLYECDLVPVGDDQKQHIELVRDIAGVINRKYATEVFKLPEPLIQGAGTRIMSLRDGRSKMSKSAPIDLSRINLYDDEQQIMHKLKQAKTDSITEINYDPANRPEIANLLNIYSSLSGYTIEAIVIQYQTHGCAKFKHDLAELIILHLSPIRTKYNNLMQNQDYLLTVLKNGALQAREVATNTVTKLKKLFGFTII